MLQPESCHAINWKGSAGATAYDIQRATIPDGPDANWETLEAGRDRSDAGSLPLFADLTAKPGVGYFYRVIAKNVAGLSKPSNFHPTPVFPPI